MNVEEALAGIARRWSRDGGIDKDYTDAGCRVLARNAFDDVEILLAVIAELRSVVQAVEEQTVEFEKALAEIDRRGLDAPSTRWWLSATVGSLRAALALADPVGLPTTDEPETGADDD